MYQVRVTIRYLNQYATISTFRQGISQRICHYAGRSESDEGPSKQDLIKSVAKPLLIQLIEIASTWAHRASSHTVHQHDLIMPSFH